MCVRHVFCLFISVVCFIPIDTGCGLCFFKLFLMPRLVTFVCFSFGSFVGNVAYREGRSHFMSLHGAMSTWVSRCYEVEHRLRPLSFQEIAGRARVFPHRAYLLTSASPYPVIVHVSMHECRAR